MADIEWKSNQLILKAVLFKASDIHIFPAKHYSQIKFRIDHQIVVIEKICNRDAEKLISHFKFRSKMDIGERRRPQNGALDIAIENRQINLRFSTLPTIPHESLSIRILPQDEVFTLNQLALFNKHTEILKSLMEKAHGLLLISGPTGSGKTTTIYSLLFNSLTRNKRIISIEDPVEKRTDAFIQIEINEKAGLTYEEALKAALRHDPDIIMIGEIRDEKTAKIVVRAAMTGHLVVSTLHAKNTLSCISRLKEFGISEHDIRETVIGLVSQRLLQLQCPYCGDECSVVCRVYRETRRLAVYEIMAGKALEAQFDGEETVFYETLEQGIAKSVALGFVSKGEYERWLC
ncbi:competence type IV pilus ATPase ComGA [Bacillaceae bacterium IKA-2]|nr:competence type IV pilus ATPase ComGA [Bacillaceae bacterium IKA-2]